TLMCALGQKQTFAVQEAMSALPPKADMCGAKADVRYGPKADMCDAKPNVRYGPIAVTNECPLKAKCGYISLHMQCAFGHLPRPESLAALVAEASLPPAPHLVVSGERCVRPEIRARHDV